MTNEQAIAHGMEQLEIFGGEHREFIKLAIKALEQEPCEDAISRQMVIDAIDKWAKNMGVLIALPASDVTPLFENIHKLPPVNPQEPKYCDRNICMANEYSGIGCDDCEVTKTEQTKEPTR